MTGYKKILEEIGYPTDIVCLDFESYFTTPYSLLKIQTIEFIRDPLFCLTGLGVGTPGSKPWFVEPSFLKAYFQHLHQDQHRYTFIVHNARFDITVMQEKFGWVPDYILDTKDLASHYDSKMSHKVSYLAKFFGLKHKGDTLRFKGYYWETMSPEMQDEFVEYTLGDVEIELQLFEILVEKLSNPRFEARVMRHTLDMWLHRRFRIDTELAKQLLKEMTEIFDGMVKKSGRTIKELRSAKFKGLIAAELNPGEEIPMKWNKPTKGKPKKRIPAFAKVDDGCTWLRAHPNEAVRNLIEARLAAYSWNTHIKRVKKLLSQSQWGRLLRVPLNYYGCHTGRYSGGEKINLQNLGSRTAELLVRMVRKLLQALDGHVLGITDSVQIEARVLAWLSGCKTLLDGFANGEDVYCDFAEGMFHCTGLRKARKTDPKPIAEYFSVRRDFGKQNILGNGYGMGRERAYVACLATPSLRPLIISGQLTKQFVKRSIDKYRKDYLEIPAYWKAVENAFRQCIRFPHLEPVVGCCTFRCVNREVQITLPSGRVLYYRECKVGLDNTIRYSEGKLWGGVITENIDQAISRDLLCWWVLQAEDAGLVSALHVHDENVTMLKIETAEADLKVQADIMCSLPDWAEGLPVDVDAKLSPCYCK